MPPVASTTAGASNSTNRPVSRKYPKAPAILPSASLISSVIVVSAKTLIIASGSPNSAASSCCSATTFCCSVRIISRPVRSPTWASRGYSCPPKFRWLILPSLVRSNTAPHASSSQTRSGASLACSSAIRQLFRNLPPRMVSRKCTCQLSFGFDVAHGGRAATFGHDRVRLAEQGLGDDRGLLAVQPRLDRGAQSRAARADDHHVVGETIDVAGRHCLARRRGGRPCVAGRYCVAHTTARSVN